MESLSELTLQSSLRMNQAWSPEPDLDTNREESLNWTGFGTCHFLLQLSQMDRFTDGDESWQGGNMNVCYKSFNKVLAKCDKMKLLSLITDWLID